MGKNNRTRETRDEHRMDDLISAVASLAVNLKIFVAVFVVLYSAMYFDMKMELKAIRYLIRDEIHMFDPTFYGFKVNYSSTAALTIN